MSRSYTKRLGAAVLALGISAASFVGSIAPAGASANEIEFRKIDTLQFPDVELTLLPPANAVAGETLRISENGTPVTNFTTRTVAEANKPVGVVLLIDISQTAKDRGLFEAQKAAIRAMLAAKKTNEQYGLVAYNGAVRPIVNLTNDGAAISNALDKLQPAGEPSLWDGIILAGDMLQAEPELEANIVVLTTAANTASDETSADAAAAVNSAKAAVFAVGVTAVRDDVNQSSLGAIADASGGQMTTIAEPAQLTQSLEAVQRNLQSEIVVNFKSEQSKVITIELALGSFVGAAAAREMAVTEGADVSPPIVTVNPPPLLTGVTGTLIIGAIALVAAGLLGYALIEIFGSDRNQLSKALKPYLDGPAEEEERDFSKLADSEIIKKAVASTARLAQDRGLLQFVQARLEQADLPLRPAEALFFTVVLALVAMIIGVLTQGLIGLMVAGMVFLYLPFAVTAFMAKRRRKKFTSQLPDMLQLLAGSMRAGYSLVQGLDAVSRQAEAPMGTELQRAMSEARLGRPIDEALQDVSDRMGSDDFEWAVMAIKIQRDVGGNLAELLITVSDTMIARERLRREISGLTAEGRMSAIILVGLPPAVGVLVMIVNPGYMSPMLDNWMGQAALGFAGVLMGVGWFVMQKMMEIEA